jgi:aryl-alcohol dehydrogenase-like predicted oxidoreductase
MKLALGTVQFGLDYGAFNRAGQVSDGEVAAILDYAAAAGVDTLDTARAYGASEAVLAQHDATARFRVITKIKALGSGTDKAIEVEASLAESRAALGAETLDTVLFHSAADLLGCNGDDAWAAAERAVDEGRVRVLGASVYNHEEALDIISRFPVKVIQLPVSIFDQRAISSGALDMLKSRGVEIHARSVFLQGFALAEPNSLPPHLRRFEKQLEAFRAFAMDAGTTPLAAALHFDMAQKAVDRVLVGVQSLAEFTQVVASAKELLSLTGTEKLASSDPLLVNPAKW